MTDAQEQVLVELVERGPLTWFRLDALLTAAGFQIGPALFAEVDRLQQAGKLTVVESPNGPKLYRVTASYEQQAMRLADVARQHRAWLQGEDPSTVSQGWDGIAFDEVSLRDSADVAHGPRRAA